MVALRRTLSGKFVRLSNGLEDPSARRSDSGNFQSAAADFFNFYTQI